MQGTCQGNGAVREKLLRCQESWTCLPNCTGMHTASPRCQVRPPLHPPEESMSLLGLLLWKTTVVQHLNGLFSLLGSHIHIWDVAGGIHKEQLRIHQTVSKKDGQQQKDGQIDPALTHCSPSSNQWAAENYSFILLTSSIFKESPEKQGFSQLASLQQGTWLLEVFAFPTKHPSQIWAQVSMLAASSKTHMSSPLFFSSYTLLGEVCKKQGKKILPCPRTWMLTRDYQTPTLLLPCWKTKASFMNSFCSVMAHFCKTQDSWIDSQKNPSVLGDNFILNSLFL